MSDTIIAVGEPDWAVAKLFPDIVKPVDVYAKAYRRKFGVLRNGETVAYYEALEGSWFHSYRYGIRDGKLTMLQAFPRKRAY